VGGKIRSECEYSDMSQTSKCPYPPVNNNLCIFHDREYGNENQDQIVNALKLLVKKANESHDSLICRGFYVPEISFEKV
jgi:hypothetical protein